MVVVFVMSLAFSIAVGLFISAVNADWHPVVTAVAGMIIGAGFGLLACNLSTQLLLVPAFMAASALCAVVTGGLIE